MDARGKLTNITNAVSGPTALAPASAITVNALGAFFSNKFLGVPITTDNGRIPGGTPQAQAFIIFHELGHSTNVLEPDANLPAAGNRNNNKINDNCAKAIKAAKR